MKSRARRGHGSGGGLTGILLVQLVLLLLVPAAHDTSSTRSRSTTVSGKRATCKCRSNCRTGSLHGNCTERSRCLRHDNAHGAHLLGTECISHQYRSKELLVLLLLLLQGDIAVVAHACTHSVATCFCHNVVGLTKQVITTGNIIIVISRSSRSSRSNGISSSCSCGSTTGLAGKGQILHVAIECTRCTSAATDIRVVVVVTMHHCFKTISTVRHYSRRRWKLLATCNNVSD
mmetsp:Transcript_23519/g.52123  ORF Transcript_23519/g.52123 Transcript_23519/m.52123 type:complete len:232 (-) Transcript_23519:445-1140(-)